MSAPGGAWGSDVPVSIPEPVAVDESMLVDMGTHVFTPDGMKLYASPAVRRELVSSAYIPIDEGDD